jgi:hypothetical protein
LPQAAVHFPVADDELAAHGTSEKTVARDSRWRERIKTMGFYPAGSFGVNALRRNKGRL